MDPVGKDGTPGSEMRAETEQSGELFRESTTTFSLEHVIPVQFPTVPIVTRASGYAPPVSPDILNSTVIRLKTPKISHLDQSLTNLPLMG
jgi:hypothetical protein